MKKILLASFATLSLLFCSNAFAEVTVTPDDKAVQQIVENWFAAMEKADVATSASFLAPNFVSVHTDGKVRSKAEELILIKNLKMETHQLSGFQFSNTGNVIVVTFYDQGHEQIDGAAISAKKALRMAVFQKQHAQWLIIAYANMDAVK